MINVYRIINKHVDIDINTLSYSLSIDPGIKSSGLCLLNKIDKSIVTSTYYSDKAANTIFPYLYVNSHSMIDNYLSFISKSSVNPNDLEVNIEYTFTAGSFAPGLMTQSALAINTLFSIGVPVVSLLPAKIPGFFLRTGKSIPDDLLEFWFSEFIPQVKADSPHSRDALMLSMFMHFKEYSEQFETLNEVRKPEFQLTELFYLMKDDELWLRNQKNKKKKLKEKLK